MYRTLWWPTNYVLHNLVYGVMQEMNQALPKSSPLCHHRAMIEALIQYLTEAWAIKAVALSGSRSGGYSDPSSDWDLYVYADAVPPLALRRVMAERFAVQAEVGNTFFEEGDELILGDGSIVDLMYRSPSWIEAEIEAVWFRHQAKVGYTTAFVHNVRTSTILYDREGWFAQLQSTVSGPYPAGLQRAIIEKNHPLLGSKLTASYREQIAKAVERADSVSAQHRISALLASYFDLLFALNEVTHPGEKRLVRWAKEMCSHLPPRFEAEVEAVCSREGDELLSAVDALLDSLDMLLSAC